MAAMSKPEILYINPYDSFANNIISLLETQLDVTVTTITHDDPTVSGDSLLAFLHENRFRAIVLGPGPGNPTKPSDVGLFTEVWQLPLSAQIPVLGICLGFQSLVCAHGGQVHRLATPRHGIVRRVRPDLTHRSVNANHQETDLFTGALADEGVLAVQYHSLYATLPQGAEDGEGDLVPLAWDYATDNASPDDANHFQGNPEKILMAVRHKYRPFWGLQFHPESICSSTEAQMLLHNWRAAVNTWWTARKSSWLAKCNSKDNPRTLSPVSIPRPADYEVQEGIQDREATKKTNPDPVPRHQMDGRLRKRVKHPDPETCQVQTRKILLGDLNIPQLCHRLDLEDRNVIVLDSENHIRTDVGEYSIIALVEDHLPRFEYTVGADWIIDRLGLGRRSLSLRNWFGGDPLVFLHHFLQGKRCTPAANNLPFWGGLVGYMSYEACRARISPPPPSEATHASVPDLMFAYIERSIVISHLEGYVYIQTLRDDDDDWLESTSSKLNAGLSDPLNGQLNRSLQSIIHLPTKKNYQDAIRAAQSSIQAGDSYELCLTTQTQIEVCNPAPPWSMYRRLRDINSAPFGAYLRLGNVTVLSSSPERFLRWSRPQRACNGHGSVSKCQLRPIKGTVPRQPDPDRGPITLDQARRLLSSQKERAENLMILDLIRHDLHGVVGSGNVTVPKLLTVEEYKTVYQLVSVIEGELNSQKPDIPRIPRGDGRGDESRNPKDACQSPVNGHGSPAAVDEPDADARVEAWDRRKSGLHVLASSLPPGSMTGAPKLRSCQLLRDLEGEQKPRGIYSGVLGYLDIGGGGDFSVVIRTAVRQSTDRDTGHERWTIGAGGAITALSDVDAEWEEMLTKLNSALRLFA